MKLAVALGVATSSVVLLVVACGGGKDDAASDPVTSLPVSQDIASLDAAGKQKLCSDVVRYLARSIDREKQKEISCGIAGAIAGGIASAFEQDGPAACRKTFADCKASPDTPTDAGDSAAETRLACELSRCAGVVVGDYVACAHDYVNALDSYVFSCDRVGSDAGTSPRVDSSPACARIAAACPT